MVYSKSYRRKRRTNRSSKRRSGKKRNSMNKQYRPRSKKSSKKKRKKTRKIRGGMFGGKKKEIIIGTLNCLGEYSNPFEFRKKKGISELEKFWIVELYDVIQNLNNVDDSKSNINEIKFSGFTKIYNKYKDTLSLILNSLKDGSSYSMENIKKEFIEEYNYYIKEYKRLGEFNDKPINIENFMNEMTDFDNKYNKTYKGRENDLRLFCDSSTAYKQRNREESHKHSSSYKQRTNLNANDLKEKKNFYEEQKQKFDEERIQADVKDKILSIDIRKKSISLWDKFSQTFMNLITFIVEHTDNTKLNETQNQIKEKLKTEMDGARNICSGKSAIDQLYEKNIINDKNTFIIACQEFSDRYYKLSRKRSLVLRQKKSDLAFVCSNILVDPIDDNEHKTLCDHVYKKLLEYLENHKQDKDYKECIKAIKKTLSIGSNNNYDQNMTDKRLFMCKNDSIETIFINIHSQDMKLYEVNKKMHTIIYNYYQNSYKKIIILSDTNMEEDLLENEFPTTRKMRTTMQVQFSKHSKDKKFRKDRIIINNKEYNDINSGNENTHNTDIYNVYPKLDFNNEEYKNVFFPNDNWHSDHAFVYLKFDDINTLTQEKQEKQEKNRKSKMQNFKSKMQNLKSKMQNFKWKSNTSKN